MKIQISESRPQTISEVCNKDENAWKDFLRNFLPSELETVIVQANPKNKE
jgi:hypothetical protein